MPRAVYQNADKSAESVYTTKIGGTRYAFMAATRRAVYVYNLDQALASNGCLEDAASAGNCPGVLVKQIATAGSASSCTASATTSSSASARAGGFQIFDVSDPLNPQLQAHRPARRHRAGAGGRALEPGLVLLPRRAPGR